MNRCPITYEPTGEEKYSRSGLKKLSPTLLSLENLPFTADELRAESLRLATKMSIQGIQPKLSAALKSKSGKFEVVEKGGTFILKPQSVDYPQLPENEDLTMRLAELGGINVPLHGMIYAKDNSLTYFVKRFDRIGRGGKIAVEDFAQLSGESRETKYDSSVEKLVEVINTYSTFPAIERVEFFRRIIFCYLTGNEDMHLKNFSLIVDQSNIVRMSPAYDLLNSTIVLQNAKKELALPLNGKKRNLSEKDFINYFAKERLQLEQKIINKTLSHLLGAIPKWKELIGISFLTEKMKTRYLELLDRRVANFAMVNTK